MQYTAPPASPVWLASAQAALAAAPPAAPFAAHRAALLAAVLDLVPLAAWVPPPAARGRPPYPRQALVAAFLAKAVYGLATTRALLDRLHTDTALREQCGLTRVPSEATFSRAFHWCAATALAGRLHQALVTLTQRDRLVGHLARDATAIAARERPQPRRPQPQARRRPARATAATRGSVLQRQRHQPLPALLRALPTACTVGVKRSPGGHPPYWSGYKLHPDVADGQIPISCVLTSAHVNDSRVAIPLMTLSSERVTACYELMDAAYDCRAIDEHCRALGRVPLIAPNQRRSPQTRSVTTPAQRPRQFTWTQAERFRERSSVERVFARLKEEFGARTVRVRGPAKVQTHLLFGVVVLTVDSLLRWAGVHPSTTPGSTAT